MRNILRIVKNDLRHITGSVVAIIIVMGLCIIPCLYAWFNIFSNWAPYESDATSRISVAVANMDKGSTAMGLKINVGDRIAEALEANKDIGWVFVSDEEAAKEEVYSGRCYAAIVVPKGFTEKVLSFTDGDLTNPKIRYYENEKKNAIAPKITGKAKTALQEEVNNAFIETLAGYVTDAAAVAESRGTDPAELLSDLSDRIEDLSGDISGCITLANSAGGLTDAAGELLSVSDTFIGSTQEVLSANGKLLEAAEKELAEDRKVNTKAIQKALKSVKETGSSLELLDTSVIELLSAGDTAYELFLENDRDDWVKKVENMKSDADSQAKLLREEGFTALASEFEELSKILDSISSELKSLSKDMDYAQRKAVLKKISEDIDTAVKLTDTILVQIREDIDENIEKALKNSRKSIASFRKAMSEADSDLGSLSNTMNSYTGSLSLLKSSIDRTSSNLRSLQGNAGEVASLLNDTSGSELLQQFSDMMSDDNAAVAEYLANPVKMKTEAIWPIETFGSIMAPFYTVLAQWIGALLTAVLIKVKIKKHNDLPDLMLQEWYFGRFGLYLLVGLAQALIVSLGDLLYIGIQCTSPVRFVLTACINGLVFMMINYALVFALDNIGLGIGVVILVLQVAGSGGTYPVEVLPPVFKTLYPLMPFRYSMDAMRECIGGMYGNTYWKCIGMLMLFLAFAAAFGMAIYGPARKLNEMIATSKAKSDIML